MDRESASSVLAVVGVRLRAYENANAAVEAIEADADDRDKVLVGVEDEDYTPLVISVLQSRLGLAPRS